MLLILLGFVVGTLLPAVHSLPVVFKVNESVICAESLTGQSEPLNSDAKRLTFTQSTCSGSAFTTNLPPATDNSALLVHLRRNCTIEVAVHEARKLGYTRYIITNNNRDLDIGWVNTSDSNQIRVYSISEDYVSQLTSYGAFLVFMENFMVDASVYVVSFIALLCVGIGSAWAGYSNEQTWMEKAQRWVVDKRGERDESGQSGSAVVDGIPFIFSEEFSQSTRSHTTPTQVEQVQESAEGNNDVHISAPADAQQPNDVVANGNTPSSAAARIDQTLLHETPVIPIASNEHQRKAKSKPKSATTSKDELSVVSILIGVAMLCGMLLLLYFFYDYLVFVFIAFFAVGSANSMYCCIRAVCNRLKLRGPLWCQYRVPFRSIRCCSCLPKKWSTKQSPRVELMLLAFFCLALSTFWVVVRRTDYGWILQDILGATLCIYVIKTFTIVKLKSITILLSLLVVYDVFMVFLSPYLVRGIRSLFMLSVTENPLCSSQSTFIDSTVPLNGLLVRHKRNADKDSVMIDVVTGSSGSSGEQVPLVFRVPSLLNSMYYCPRPSWTMLGFGDVIIPGLLIAFVFKFERITKTRVPYFIITFGGYICGLVICYVSAFAMRSGQPALLFIIPLTLLPVLAIASLKSHLKEMWTGALCRNLPLSAKLELGDVQLAMNVNDSNNAPGDSDIAIELSQQSVGQGINIRYDAANRDRSAGKTIGSAVLFSADSEDRINTSVNGSLDLDDRSTAESRCLLRS